MDPKVQQLLDEHDQHNDFLMWVDEFDNVPYILAEIAYRSLVLKQVSYSCIDFSDMPLCKEIPNYMTGKDVSAFFNKVLNTVGDELVKSIILKAGPLAFTQEDLPPELGILLDTELVQKSIANYRKATEARQRCGIIIHKCSYSLAENSNFEYGYHENYKWWDDTGLRKYNCE